MESYPNEFTAHHRPLLFVAGIHSNSGETTQEQLDPFHGLVNDLRTTLTGKSAQYSLWDNTRGLNNEFHVALVEKTVRFPPLKARPSSEQPAAPLHSPISPLSPSSPLYPDGIIAPIWIRKHREMVPSVFLLALRLYEFIPPAGTIAGPLDGNLVALREEEERRRDAELVKEIIERRRTTVERGIKLAVVLLCSRPLLDSSSLDARLSQIRRQSTLDSRASLFVISPVDAVEVENFVASLRRELWDAALDYYREHGRRVRRKRARSLSGKGGLGEKGWTVRYDYKMGFMAEMRGEIEVSLKHYEDCYDTLLEMFPQPNLLAPRTKRWAEAKVLADCLTVKISKFYLYLNESSRSVAQLNRHIFLFRALSETWGIGEQTFEFWSWLSKQYRLYAELVSLAVRSGFRLPLLRPPPQPRSVPAGVAQPNLAGLVPENVLQHAGYYFYLSATCTVERRNRYRAVASEGQEGAPISPAIAHESKVNHSEIIIDLYTKAYEYFKLHHSSRMSLFMASQIALAHHEAGNYATAVKFHDRIASTYRREGWTSILQPIVRMMSNSALELGDYESAVRSLLELVAPESDISLQERQSYCAQLLEVLRTKPCPTTTPITIDTSDSATTQLFDTQVVFWREECEVNESVPFQISIAAPSTSRTSSLVFEKMTIYFNGDVAPIAVTNHGTENAAAVEMYELVGGQETPANLCWRDGTTKVFAGTVLPSTAIDLTVSSITLELKEGDWILELRLRNHPDPSGMPRWYTMEADQPALLARRDASVCIVRPRSLRVDVQIIHADPAYLDEEFPIHLEILNQDDVPVTIQLDTLLQPIEGESQNRIMVNDESSLSLIKGVLLGVLAPGATLRTIVRLLSVGTPGPRQIDLSIRVESTSVPNPSASSPASANLSAIATSALEIVRTVNIQSIAPFFSAFELDSFHRRRGIQPLMDLNAPTGRESSQDVALTAKLAACGPWDVEVLAIDLVVSELERKVLRVVDSSLDGQESSFPLRWSPGDAYNIMYRLDVAPTLSPIPSTSTTSGALNVSWRRIGELNISTTRIPLPSLDPSLSTPSITLRLPTFLTLHAPANLLYRFSNPTSRLLNLSTSIEGAENFVFAGPRKFPRFVLAPEEERVLTLVVIPLAVGSCSLPRLRVFVDRTAEATRSEDLEEAEVRERVVEEVTVNVETDSMIQSEKAASRAGEVGSRDPLVVLVLPR